MIAKIQPLVDGLTILKTYDAGALVVALSYMIMVPDIHIQDISDSDRSALLELGWVEHTPEDTYVYVTVA